MHVSNPIGRATRTFGAVLVTGGLLGCAAGPAAAQPSNETAQQRPTLTVTGSGEVAVAPDRAVVRLGVVAQAATAADAQQQVNRAMQQLLQALARRNVPERAIRTEELSMWPVYSDQLPVSRQEQAAGPRITGYRASNVVSVELDDLAAVGGVIDAGIEAGGNQLQGVTFGLRDEATARAEALARAVQDARAQAEAIAAAMNARVGEVSQAVAGGGGVSPPMPFARMAADAGTPVQPGQVQVSATVTITYFLTGSAARR